MPWGGRRAQRLRAVVLARDYVPALGYTPCAWCGGVATTADHYPTSRADGGSDALDNLISACGPCNSSRGASEGNRRRIAPRPSRKW